MLSLRATCGLARWARSLHDTVRRVVCARSHAAWPPTPCGGLLQGREMETTAMRAAAVRADSAGSSPDVPDRKSTRLNSSHQIISYAVFCLKKKKNNKT